MKDKMVLLKKELYEIFKLSRKLEKEIRKRLDVILPDDIPLTKERHGQDVKAKPTSGKQ